jgi:hypothetical protein
LKQIKDISYHSINLDKLKEEMEKRTDQTGINIVNAMIEASENNRSNIEIEGEKIKMFEGITSVEIPLRKNMKDTLSNLFGYDINSVFYIKKIGSLIQDVDLVFRFDTYIVESTDTSRIKVTDIWILNSDKYNENKSQICKITLPKNSEIKEIKPYYYGYSGEEFDFGIYVRYFDKEQNKIFEIIQFNINKKNKNVVEWDLKEYKSDNIRYISK